MWVVVYTCDCKEWHYTDARAWLIRDGEAAARRFAEILTEESCPAVALPLASPVVELTAIYDVARESEFDAELTDLLNRPDGEGPTERST